MFTRMKHTAVIGMATAVAFNRVLLEGEKREVDENKLRKLFLALLGCIFSFFLNHHCYIPANHIQTHTHTQHNRVEHCIIKKRKKIK